MATFDLRKIGLVIALVSLNLFLFNAATELAFPMWIICVASLTGAVIGILAKGSWGNAVIRALAGSAIAIFNVLGFIMTIFARLLPS